MENHFASSVPLTSRWSNDEAETTDHFHVECEVQCELWNNFKKMELKIESRTCDVFHWQRLESPRKEPRVLAPKGVFALDFFF
jgi:hypothetical protein